VVIEMAEARVKAIFNAARRYCIDHGEPLKSKIMLYYAAREAAQDSEILRAQLRWNYLWAQRLRQAPRLDQLPPFPPEEETRASALVDILAAILEEIERRVADDFQDVGETRAFLVAAGQRAKTLRYQSSMVSGERRVTYHEPDWSPQYIAAREEARSGYLSYVARLSLEEAAGVPTVPYRQVMSESKRQRVGRELYRRWRVDPLQHYWYPLWEDETPADVLATQDWYFHKEVGAAALQAILLRHGVTRVWQVEEAGLPPEYELHPCLCTFGGWEAYWSSRELDWLVYASHEASITFAGAWLVEEIKRAWPNWEQRVYRDYVYERSFS
jgi:hypothetical protein